MNHKAEPEGAQTLMRNGIITKEKVRVNPVILKHFISVSLLPTSYPVKDETEKKRGEFLAVILAIKREADLMLLSFAGNLQHKDRDMKDNYLITKGFATVFQFYLCHQMKHGTGKGASFTVSRAPSREP